MSRLRTIAACSLLFAATAAVAAADLLLDVTAVSRKVPGGALYLFVDERLPSDGTAARKGVIRIACERGKAEAATMLWTEPEAAGRKKMMGAPKIGEATAITSIGLPKITPKIAKESHGRIAMPGGGWFPITFSDPNAACAVAAKAVESAR